MNTQPINPILVKIQTEIENKVSPQYKKDFERVVVAVDTYMFSKKTHRTLTMIQDPEQFKKNPVGTVAKGVARLLKLLWIESKKTLKEEPLIYGGIIAITRAFDFAERGLGHPFDASEVARATKLFMELVFETLGVKPEQLAQAIAQGQKEIDDYQKHQAFLDGKIAALRPKAK